MCDDAAAVASKCKVSFVVSSAAHGLAAQQQLCLVEGTSEIHVKELCRNLSALPLQ